MSQKITLTAADNHDLDAWRSAPDARVKGGKAKGGIVLLHAIYGLTTHISPLKKALLTGFHSTAKHNATKAVSPSSETMRTI